MRFPSSMMLVGAVWCAGCQAAHTAEATEPHEFSLASPVVTTATYEREYVGDIQAAQRVELRARLKGVIEAIGVDEGQAVRAGQLLFTLSARELQQELSQAQASTKRAAAELKAAQVEQANTRILFDKKIIADAEMAQVEAKIQVLEASLEEARSREARASINLTYSRVLAPFDGVVSRFPNKVGSIVDEGDLLTTIINANEVLVYFRVSEQEYLDLTTDGTERPKEVRLRLANGQLYESMGSIDAGDNEFDRSTGNIAFRARFPNARQALKHGSSGKVVLTVDLKNALMIPQKSTFEVQDHMYLYTVDANNVAHAKRIVTKLRLKDAFIIESGIDASDRFVLDGIQKVKDGDIISPRLTTSTSL